MKTLLIKLILLNVLYLLTGCDYLPGLSKPQALQSANKSKQRPAHAVKVISVQRKPASIERTLTGSLEATRTIHIHSELAGRIISLPYHEGDRVEKGAVLAQLDDALRRAELAKAVAIRKQKQINLTRLQKLIPTNLATEDEVARAITELELAQAEEKLQQILISRTVIKSPFRGVISERLKEPGDIVAMNDHLLTLFDPQLISATVQLPEQLHSRVNLGDSVNVRIDSLGDQSFNASIHRIHPVLDSRTRQGTIEILLQPVPSGVHPGQLCRVTVKTDPTERLIIPLKALQFDSSGSYVYRVDDASKTQHIPVISGLQFGEFIEIVEGISENDRVVVKGFLGLKAGKTVRVIKQRTDTSLSPDTFLQRPGQITNASTPA